MRYGLPDNAVQQILTVLKKYEQVDRAILYGSRAKGNYKNGSDIDLTLCGNEKLTLNIVYRILEDIDDLFLPYKIDLSIYRELQDPNIIEHIQRVGILFYEKSPST
jgi:predicted nucleotidyltransferase